MLNILTNMAKIEIPKVFEISTPLKPDVRILEKEFHVDLSLLKPIGLRLFIGDDLIVHKCLSYGNLKLLLKDPIGLKGLTDIIFTRQYRLFRQLFKGESIWKFIKTILMIKFLMKFNLTFIHSSGVSINNEAYLFTGWSDIGKTSTAIGLLELKKNILSYISSDIALVSQSGDVYAWPGFTKKVIARPFEKIPLLRGFSIKRPLNLWQSIRIEYKSRISHLFVLERGFQKSDEKIDAEEAFRRIVTSTDIAVNFIADHILLAYSHVNPSFNILALREKHLNILRRLVEKAECYKLIASSPKGFIELALKYIL